MNNRAPTADAARELRRHRSREWHLAFRLPWEVWVEGRRLARFADERDARGFARARYGARAELVNLRHEAEARGLDVEG